MNPYEIILSLAKKSPNMKGVVEALERGEKPETVFRNLCKERGIDPDEFIKKIR